MDEDAEMAAHAQLLLEAQQANDPHLECLAILPVLPKRSIRRTATLEQAFFGRLAFGVTDCWYWVGARSDIGYGIFQSARSYGVPEMMAHRISWTLFNGPVPKGLKVLHVCDVRCCVNPEHLFLGTQADNVHDMYRKGRNKPTFSKGEANGGAKLTEAMVIEMRQIRTTGLSFKKIGTLFSVSPMTAYRAIVKQAWSHI